MKYTLRSTNLSDIKALLQEAESTQAFLPSKDEPAFSVSHFLSQFKADHRVYIFTLIHETPEPDRSKTILEQAGFQCIQEVHAARINGDSTLYYQLII